MRLVGLFLCALFVGRFVFCGDCGFVVIWCSAEVLQVLCLSGFCGLFSLFGGLLCVALFVVFGVC